MASTAALSTVYTPTRCNDSVDTVQAPLARIAGNRHTSPPSFFAPPRLVIPPGFTRSQSQHRVSRCVAAAGIALLVVLTAGCALWNPDVWNLDRYRDERTVDIERRLSREKPLIENSF